MRPGWMNSSAQPTLRSELSKTGSRVEKLAQIEFPLSPSFVVNFVVNFL
jgi:hypothetical protein